MSGLDEQFRDIPSCPLCGRKPAFWILTDGTNENSNDASHWVWYFQKDYKASWTGKRANNRIIQLMGVEKEFLREGIRAVTCRPIDIIFDNEYTQHRFHVGDKTFDLVMNHLRAEVRRNGFCVGN